MTQAHGYAGLNFGDLAEQLGIKAAGIYYHFPSKADLATAVAKRYWEDAAAYLESLLENSAKPLDALRRYPETFCWALENDNRICLCSTMSTQFDDLRDEVGMSPENGVSGAPVTTLNGVIGPGKFEAKQKLVSDQISLRARRRFGCGRSDSVWSR